MDEDVEGLIDALLGSMRSRMMKMCESSQMCFVKKSGPSIAEVILLSSKINGRPTSDFFVKRNKRGFTDTRRLAWWYMVDVMGYRAAEVAEITGHDRTTVLNLVKDFEDKLRIGDKNFIRMSKELKDSIEQMKKNENSREDSTGN